MASGFPGFPKEGLQFLSELSRNNQRDWFLPRKPLFEEKVKQPMRELVSALNTALKSFAPDHVVEPDRAIMRFYRDTRFSKDKSPYKTNLAANFPRRSDDRHEGAGFYVSVSHKALAIGGGIYMPLPETLLAMRTHIAERHEEFRKIAETGAARKLFGELAGERLSRIPKGFPAAHPAADLLRLKQYVLYVELDAELAAGPDVVKIVKKHFQAAAPLVEFLNAPLIAARKRKGRVDPRLIGYR